ncbi:MAG: hypothetical protein ACK54K_05330, partial [Gemmatimonadaceae bacterium]
MTAPTMSRADTASPRVVGDAVERTRRAIATVQRARTLLVSLGAGLLVVLLARVVRALGGVTGELRTWPVVLGLLAAGVAWVVLARRRRALDAVQVALWIEEQRATPPDFSLVTYMEQVAPAPAALTRAAEVVWAQAAVAEGLVRLRREA